VAKKVETPETEEKAFVGKRVRVKRTIMEVYKAIARAYNCTLNEVLEARLDNPDLDLEAIMELVDNRSRVTPHELLARVWGSHVLDEVES